MTCREHWVGSPLGDRRMSSEPVERKVFVVVAVVNCGSDGEGCASSGSNAAFWRSKNSEMSKSSTAASKSPT